MILLLIGQTDSIVEFPLPVGLSLMLTVFSAMQDIATDALTCRLLPAFKTLFQDKLHGAKALY